MDSASTRLLDKRYRITNTLCERDYERHYVGRHVELDIPVRIVTLDLPVDDSGAPHDGAVAHIWALAARATALRHPSLVRVRDCFRSRRTFSVVAEWVEGETLAARMKRRGRLSLRETLTYGLQLCDLLAYVARQGAALMPFLNITPDTLVVQDDDRIVLTDLGTIHWLHDRDTIQVPSQLPYIAPEVRTGASANSRANIYSVAAVLFTALAGQPPAFGPEALPLSMLAPLAPAALCDTIERALDPDPYARYAGPEDFGGALGRSVHATLPAVAALAQQPQRQPTSITVAQALAPATHQLWKGTTFAAHALTSPGRRENARHRLHARSQVPSRVMAPRQLRRTGERALAAISYALHLGA